MNPNINQNKDGVNDIRKVPRNHAIEDTDTMLNILKNMLNGENNGYEDIPSQVSSEQDNAEHISINAPLVTINANINLAIQFVPVIPLSTNAFRVTQDVLIELVKIFKVFQEIDIVKNGQIKWKKMIK